MAVFCLPLAQRLAEAQTATVTQPGVSGSYRIAGTIVSKADGHPLARARVTIREVKNRKNTESLITAPDGKFEFNALPSGKYSLDGAKRGFISAAYDQHEQFSTAIVTGAGLDTESLVLKLAPTAIIAGKILDEFGDPVRQSTVTLYRDNHQEGVDQIQSFRSTETDDLGAYEFAPLMPGNYFVSAKATPWYAIHPHSAQRRDDEGSQAGSSTSVDRSLDVTYPATYYPDVTETDRAAPIPIKGGEHVQVDIHLNPVQGLRLILHVPVNPTHGFRYPQLEQSTFDSSTFLQNLDLRMISPEEIEISGIPAGRYNIRFPSPGQDLQLTGIDLSEDGEQIDVSHADASSTVKLSARVLGGEALPQVLAIGLSPGTRTRSVWQRIDAKGEAEYQHLSPGTYEIMVAGFGKRYFIQHVSADGAAVSGHSVKIVSGASLDLALTLSAGDSEIQGTAKLAGKAFAGAMIVLVPKNPEQNHDLFRRDQSDLDGTFVFHGVVPGSYTILAIEDGWDLDWSQPGVIAAYASRGKAIEVGSQVGPLLNLTEPIEVQSK